MQRENLKNISAQGAQITVDPSTLEGRYLTPEESIVMEKIGVYVGNKTVANQRYWEGLSEDDQSILIKVCSDFGLQLFNQDPRQTGTMEMIAESVKQIDKAAKLDAGLPAAEETAEEIAPIVEQEPAAEETAEEIAPIVEQEPAAEETAEEQPIIEPVVPTIKKGIKKK